MLKLKDKNKKLIAGLINYKDLCIESALSTGDKKLSFSLPKEDKFYNFIEEECYIETKEAEFVIKARDVGVDYTRFDCVLNLEELEANIFDRFESVEQTITASLNLAIVGTGWTVNDNTLKKKRTVRCTNKNALEIVQEIKKTYRVDIVFNTLKREIEVYEHLGENKGTYFIDSLNLTALQVQSDSYKFATRIIAEGKDGLTFSSINNGKNYAENYQYSNKIKTIYWKDERYTVKESLLEDAKAKLEELSKPFTSYNASVLNLAELNPKYKSILDYSLGDTITLLSKSNKVKDKQRIVKTIEWPQDHTKDTVELANATLKFEDIQQENQETTDTVNNITTDNGTINGSTIDSITTKQIEDFEANVIKVAKLKAILAEIENLHVNKADIQNLNAVIARIGTLEATKASITELNAIHAIIQQIKAGKADIADLNAAVAKVGILENKTAVLENALAGNLTADNFKTNAITAGSAVIAEGAIGSSQISSLSVNKLEAGDITTSKHRIVSADGTIEIVGNQILINRNNVNRVILGEYRKSDGTTEYGLLVRAKDGQTIMLDGNGVHNAGITDGAIDNNKVADNANISGNKLDINSVIREVNNNGTETIKGTKVTVGDRTLDVELSTQKNTITEHGKELSSQKATIQALDNAIKLKVDNQTFTSATQTINRNILGAKEEAINAANKNTTNAINNIEIGSRNLWLNTGFLDNLNHFGWYGCENISIINESTSTSGKAISFVPTNGGGIYQRNGGDINNYITFKEGEKLVISGYFKVTSGAYLRVGLEGTSYYKNFSPSAPNEWSKFELLAISNGKVHTFTLYGVNGNAYTIRNIKVERGTKATDWTPAPEDLQAYAEKYANDVAIAKAELAKQQAIANADGKITEEEKKRIKQAEDNLNTAIAKANEVENKAREYADAKKIEAINKASADAALKAAEALNSAKAFTTAEISTTNSNLHKVTSEINILKDRIESKVGTADVEKAIQNIKFGGRNLLRNTGLSYDSKFWLFDNGIGRSSNIDSNLAPNNHSIFIDISGVNQDEWRAANPEAVPCIAGEIFSASVLVMIPSNDNRLDDNLNCAALEIQFWDSTGRRLATETTTININTPKDKWYKIICENRVSPPNTVKVNARVWVRRNGRFWIGNIKLIKGNKIGDWSPAPEDSDTFVIDNIKTVTDKITTVESNLTQKTNSIEAGVRDLNSTTQSITTNVSNINRDLTSKINSSLDVAKNFATDVATNKANTAKQEAIVGARNIPDTRNDNQNPQWYIEHYPKQLINEFKNANVIGITGTTYGILETKVPWVDSSGGFPVQTFRSNNTPTYQRRGLNSTNWSAWEQIEDTQGSQAKANDALNNAKSYANAQITTVNSKVHNVESNLNILSDRINSKVSQSDIDKAVTTIRTEKIIYARGTGNDFPSNALVKVNGKTITDGQGRGLRINALNKSTLERVFLQDYDTFGSEDAKLSFVNKINELNNGDYIIIITSQDASYPLHPPIKEALEKIGATLFDNKQGTYREAYALIGKSKLGRGNGVEMFIPRTANDKRFAEVSVKVGEDGTFIGVNPNNMGLEATLIRSNISDVSSELTQTKNSIEASINSINSKTQSIETNLNGKATKQEVTDVNNKVSTIKANLDSITQRVSTTESKTHTLENTINGKANKQDITNVSNKVASIETNVNGITQRVSNTESRVNTLNGQIQNATTKQEFTEFKQGYDNFTYNVSKNFGSKNLIRNSGFLYGYNYFYPITSNFDGHLDLDVWTDNSEWVVSDTCALVIRGGNFTKGACGARQDGIKLKPNTKYTIAFSAAAHRCKWRLSLNTNGWGQLVWVEGNSSGGKDPNNWDNKSITFTTGPSASEITNCKLDLVMQNRNANDPYAWFTNLILVEGDFAPKWTPMTGENYSNTVVIDKDKIKTMFEDGTYAQMGRDGFEWYNAGTGHSYHALTYVTSFDISIGNPGKVYIRLPAEFTKRRSSLKWTVALRGYYYNTTGNFFPFHVHCTGARDYIENGLVVCEVQGLCKIQNGSNSGDVQFRPLTAMLIAIA